MMSDAEPLKRRLLVVGQSHADAWRPDHLAWDAFTAARRRMRDRAAWTRRVWAPSGSAALREFAEPDSDRWWVDIERDEPSPHLKQLLDLLRIEKVETTEILWTQGQREARWLALNPGTMTDEAFAERYIEGVRQILQTIRTAIAPDWRAIPTYVEIIGCGSRGDRPCFQAVRAAQRELLSRYGATDNLRQGAESPLDVPLRDAGHPAPAGEAIMGWLTARAIRLGHRDLAPRAVVNVELVRGGIVCERDATSEGSRDA